VQTKTFINYYEVLELDPGSSAVAIEHRFRHLARRYHPDNQATADRARFDALVEAHNTLRDARRRAQYHDEHREHLPPLAQDSDGDAEEDLDAAEDIVDGSGIDRDLAVQNNILALLYLRRRRNIREPGMGNAELEHLSGCPSEHLEFHLWYLKSKGWIGRGDDGLLSITIDGVDRAAAIYRENAKRLITDQT